MRLHAHENQFSPGFGAIVVELEHLLLEVVGDLESCIFPVKVEAFFVPLSCRFNIAKSVDIFGGYSWLLFAIGLSQKLMMY